MKGFGDQKLGVQCGCEWGHPGDRVTGGCDGGRGRKSCLLVEDGAVED